MIPDRPFAIERLIDPADSAGKADAMTRHVIGAAGHVRADRQRWRLTP